MIRDPLSGNGELDPQWLLTGDAASADALKAATLRALELLTTRLRDPRVYSGAVPQDLAAELARHEIMPETGTGILQALEDIGPGWLDHALNVNAPDAMAHLHCSVAVSSVIAEILIAATNQSLDSWDQSPLASLMEDRVIGWLAAQAGLPGPACGCFTSGGSQSNMTALYLAIEAAGSVDRRDLVIFTSDQAHFSLRKSARILGLGLDAVVAVACDDQGRMPVAALRAAIRDCAARGRRPLAVCATAGTTDLGAIDPLDDIARVAHDHELWLHVDAAYGGGLMFGRHRDLLAGMDRANSVTLDFHKMLFQPASCGALLLRDRASFAPLASKADYLNPEVPVFADVPNLVERSVQTTRRADVLKVCMTLRTLGRKGLDALLCRTLENTRMAAALIEAHPAFGLAHSPELSTVVFRHLHAPKGAEDLFCARIRETLLHRGQAAIATTRYRGLAHFKLTLLNPASGPGHVSALLDAIGMLAADAAAQQGAL